MDLRGSLGGLGAVRERVLTRPLRRVAERAAAVDRLPTEARAALGHYARGGRLDVAALRLQSAAESRVAAIVDDAFEGVERAIADDCDVDPATVSFDYETKLLLPVELTLVRLYRDLRTRAPDGYDPVDRTVDPGIEGQVYDLLGVGAGEADVDPAFSALAREADRVDRVTRLVVVALLDGDMRDAVNDAEYEEFEVTVAGEPVDTRDDLGRERVAELAQSTLERAVEERFDRFPEDVRAAYERAVAASEAHQERDPEFRELYETARDGDPEATTAVCERYRDADFDVPPEGYDRADLELPYFRTQYGRVGVIYDGMFAMYEAAGVRVEAAFRRAVVLTIVYAQVWLDDVDDYAADAREGQLTPVTAAYLLAADREGHRRVRGLAREYADRARELADRSRSPLVGVAVEYVTRSGDLSTLPGTEQSRQASTR
ncbi:hypothetical protein BRD18_04535 [Halobacteriales archaeon SW_7_71_33]|nr:MAG: hypothetical protein BRD18_04535 [Halobacteriales archaeon SW_7_71_33]